MGSVGGGRRKEWKKDGESVREMEGERENERVARVGFAGSPLLIFPARLAASSFHFRSSPVFSFPLSRLLFRPSRSCRLCLPAFSLIPSCTRIRKHPRSIFLVSYPFVSAVPFLSHFFTTLFLYVYISFACSHPSWSLALSVCTPFFARALTYLCTYIYIYRCKSICE